MSSANLNERRVKVGLYAEKLPRDKFDFERVNQIKKCDKQDVIPLLPGLLEWIQDMNWPIAAEIADILVTFPKEMVPHIKHVFSTDDDIWKYWCLVYVVKKFSKEDKELLRAELIRLSSTPTAGERLEEVDQKAREILLSIS
jgi:hypothetical protein